MANNNSLLIPTAYPVGRQPETNTHPLNTSASDEAESLLINDPFFPDISLKQVREQLRIDGTVTEARLKQAVLEAMIAVNEELADFQHEHREYEALSEIPAMEIQHESVLIYRYKRAVHCLALANLYERYLSFDASKEGEKKAELLKESVNELRRDARFAISDMLKKRRVDAELI